MPGYEGKFQIQISMLGGGVQRKKLKLGDSLSFPVSKQQSSWIEYKLYLLPQLQHLDNVKRPMLQCALRYVQKVDQEMSIYISLDVLP